MTEQLKIAVFASGRGSNFVAVQNAIEAEKIPNAKIVLVISNNSDANVLATAREKNIPALHLSRKQFPSDKECNEMLLKTLREHGVNFILLAGYMKMLDEVIVREYNNRIINIHPALLPRHGGKGMYGMHVHEAVISAKEQFSGATVHIVNEEYDRGPVVLQKKVAVSETDTAQTLAEKVLAVEHEIYPEAVRLFAEGRVRVDGADVTIAKA